MTPKNGVNYLIQSFCNFNKIIREENFEAELLIVDEPESEEIIPELNTSKVYDQVPETRENSFPVGIEEPNPSRCIVVQEIFIEV